MPPVERPAQPETATKRLTWLLDDLVSAVLLGQTAAIQSDRGAIHELLSEARATGAKEYEAALRWLVDDVAGWERGKAEPRAGNEYTVQRSYLDARALLDLR
jgi:hypothetical protein